MKLHSEQYRKYLCSFDWWLRSRAALERSGFQCQHVDHHGRCPVTTNLEVHHRTYERLGYELASDLVVFCKRHHRLADSLDGERRRHDARLDGWAKKRYGEDWELCCDYDDVAEEFNEFLDRLDDDT